MKLVIDANIGFKALVPEQNSDIALKLLEDFRKGVHDLLAPDLYPTEISNILVMAARSRWVQESDLPILYGELMSDLPILYTSTSLLPEAFKHRVKNSCVRIRRVICGSGRTRRMFVGHCG